ncbi:MAG: isoaspartyl peptidase/L-asparaginase, partial [Spirochaetia bacterium]
MLSQWLTESPDPRFVVQVHGGAWNIPADLKGPHTDGVHHAYDAAMHALGQGQRPLDVVVSTLRILEDDPTFDAGTGSFLNEDGKVELDAALMEGKNLRAGAVASIGRFRNPSEIARAVMERTEHVLLIAEGAERFALSAGFVPVDPESLVDPRERMGFQAWVAAGKPDARTFFDEEGRVNAGGSPSDHERRGTVGVVIGVRVGPGTGYSVYAGAST